MHGSDFSDKLSSMFPRFEHLVNSGGAFFTSNSIRRDTRSFSSEPLCVSVLVLQTVLKRTLMDSLFALFFCSLFSEGVSFLLIFLSYFGSFFGCLRNFSIYLLNRSIIAVGNNASSLTIGSRFGNSASRLTIGSSTSSHTIGNRAITRAVSSRWGLVSNDISTISIEFRVESI
jgi:hypothetical protein